MWISPVPSCAGACAAALVFFGAPFISSCRPSLDAEGPAAQRDGAVDFAARQAAALQRNDAVAEAYRKERAGALPSNADEVIARHLEAVGGREALDTVQTMVVRLSVHGTAGRVGGLIRYYRKPLFYRQHMSSDASALVTDGRRAWSVGPDGWEEREGGVASFLPMASMDEHLMAPEEAGLTHELLGVVAMDSDPGFQVRRVWPQGREDLLYFSAISGLLTGIRSAYPLMAESWLSYWDYRDLGGIRIPHVAIRSVGDLGPPHGTIVESVEINVPLPDSLFLPPWER